ncbi:MULTISPECIES: helix-turn-helix domain-containing protein [unclassified Roseovarius]|uniref:helix-turn-helix domain-containing protein n=1 Tax=unclassified Roseovarius TaxID=2614913 RepID=UPI00273E1641|nr:AraC family transcriptional regulator [Roseovarius sp. MMSF_3350]
MTSHPQLQTLAQWIGPGAWRASLPHSDPHHVFLWITRGQGRCLVGGQRRGLAVHTALVLPAGSLFALDPGAQSFGLACRIPPRTGILMPDEPVLLRVRDPRAQADLTTLLETMQREQNEARDFMDEAMTAHAQLLTVWLRRAMISIADEASAPTAAHRLVEAYAALIERDFRTGASMQDFARHLGVTPTHLSRVCKSSSGLTASAMLTGRVLHAARHLLETTDRPANQVAADLGFNSAAYFSRFILRHTGKSPSDLRRTAPRKAA